MSPDDARWEALRNELFWGSFLSALPMVIFNALLVGLVVYLLIKARTS